MNKEEELEIFKISKQVGKMPTVFTPKRVFKLRKAELEATIKYYENLSLWDYELTENDKAELAKAEAELKEYENTARPTG